MQQTLVELADIQLAKEAAAHDNLDWLEEKIREEAANSPCDIWPFSTLPKEL